MYLHGFGRWVRIPEDQGTGVMTSQGMNLHVLVSCIHTINLLIHRVCNVKNQPPSFAWETYIHSLYNSLVLIQTHPETSDFAASLA